MSVRERYRFREYTVQHDQTKPTTGTARCLWEAEDGGPGCDWTSGLPMALDALTKALGKHCAETDHTEYGQTVRHSVTVVPGKWDGEA
ncbi:hypothetical protein GCM10020229_45710 [Kitasatospora albolonga]|uniref:DUF7848 domain-containing protein n=1 Tax=Kitasatospora albolonga TaxID=68173 RepID=UPI0031F195CF